MRGVTLLKFERELKGLFFVIRLILDLGHEHLRVDAAMRCARDSVLDKGCRRLIKGWREESRFHIFRCWLMRREVEVEERAWLIPSLFCRGRLVGDIIV